MTTYADVKVDNEIIRVEIDPYVAEGEVQVSLEQVSKRLESSFEDAMLVIRTAGERIIKTFHSLSHVPSGAFRDLVPELEFAEFNLSSSPNGAKPGVFEMLPSPSTWSFIDRDARVNEVLDLLGRCSARVLICGMGGIGKTTTALQVAYECLRQQRYDTIVWITAELGINAISIWMLVWLPPKRHISC